MAVRTVRTREFPPGVNNQGDSEMIIDQIIQEAQNYEGMFNDILCSRMSFPQRGNAYRVIGEKTSRWCRAAGEVPRMLYSAASLIGDAGLRWPVGRSNRLAGS